MINVLKKINKEIDLIDQELQTKNERFEFYQDFFKKNSCRTLSDTIAANHSELAIATIVYRAPNLSIDEVKEAVYGNKEVFEEFDEPVVENLMFLFTEIEKLRSIYEQAKKMLIAGTDSNMVNLFKKEQLMIIALKPWFELAKTTPKNFCNLIDLVLLEPRATVEAISMVATLRKIKSQEEVRYQLIPDVSLDGRKKIKDKDKNKIVSDITKYRYNIKQILEPLTQARDEYLHLEQEQRTRRRILSRNKSIYESLETDLYNAVKAGEIKNIDSLIKKVPSDEIRLAILKLVYTHNQEIYDELSEEYKELAANDASHYQALLAKYGISPETYEVGTVMENSIENLGKMLELLSKLKITNPQELLAIVQNSDLETVQNIQGLAERSIITTALLTNHLAIFNPSSKEYEDFMRNLALINKKKINPHNFTTSEEVFVIPHQQFATSIKTLEDYELLTNIKTGMNLDFLKEQDLPEIIDTLLELGYEKNLEECLELLNYKEKFDRLKVLKILNIPVTDTQGLLEVLSTDKFYLPDSEISKYIYNAVNHNLPSTVIEAEEAKKNNLDVTRLSQFSHTSRTYDFNGVIISKNKVQKNLSHILSVGKAQERLLYGVLKGSTLTDEEVLKVVGCLTAQKTARTVKEKK